MTKSEAEACALRAIEVAGNAFEMAQHLSPIGSSITICLRLVKGFTLMRLWSAAMAQVELARKREMEAERHMGRAICWEVGREAVRRAGDDK